MSVPEGEPAAKLFVSVMYTASPDEIVHLLVKKFGSIQAKSDIIDFNFTNYYADEFGTGLKKCFICFEKAFDLEQLPSAKHFCYRLECKFTSRNKRQFNIDPGYVTSDSVVLATFKRRAHRIYLEKKVYADLELVFENNAWQPFRWSFKDIQEKSILAFFSKIKESFV